MSASSITIQNCVLRRLGHEGMRGMITTYGFSRFWAALDIVGELHAGCEEIGSSDVSAFVKTFKNHIEND